MTPEQNDNIGNANVTTEAPVLINLDTIDLKESYQGRVSIDDETISEYQEKIAGGQEFPPLKIMELRDNDGRNVIKDGRQVRVLIDGHHTLRALLNLKRTKFQAVISSGTDEDAFWASIAQNSKHGLKLKNCDKKRIVTLAFKRNPELSFNTLAARTNVSVPFVSGICKPLLADLKAKAEAKEEKEIQRVGKDGRKLTPRKKADEKKEDQKGLELGEGAQAAAPEPEKPKELTKAEKDIRGKIVECFEAMGQVVSDVTLESTLEFFIDSCDGIAEELKKVKQYVKKIS